MGSRSFFRDNPKCARNPAADQVTPYMVPAIESLPDDIEALKQSIISYAKECDLLHETVRLLTARLFGRRSEQYLHSGLGGLGVEQLLLFGMTEDRPTSPEPDKVGDTGARTLVGAHERQKGKRKPLPAHLPRVPIRHELAEAHRLCGCGAVKQEISVESSEQLDYVRAVYRVLLHIRPKYACQHCEGSNADGLAVKQELSLAQDSSPVSQDPSAVDSAASPRNVMGPAVSPTVVIAPMPPHIIPKSLASPGLLAHVMAAKFVDGMPFYRQEAQFLREGVHIGRATMCGWALKIAEACDPLLELLWQEVRAGPLIQYDESPLQVLDEPGRAAATKSYMWVALGGLPERRAVVFEYSETRSSATPKKRLHGYSGGVQTDDYSGYDFIRLMVLLLHFGCFAHVRRKFTDVLKAAGTTREDGKGTLADQALSFILRLYQIEWGADAAGISGDDLVAWRQQHARPVLQEFHHWLVEWAPKVPPKSLLGKAISYTLGLWSRLERYIDYAYVTLDNNRVENALRPYVLGRKNWLFSATPAGARATALFYTLVETAKLNGVEPYSYFCCLFERLPYAQTTSERQALLPMNIDRELVKPYIVPPRPIPKERRCTLEVGIQ